MMTVAANAPNTRRRSTTRTDVVLASGASIVGSPGSMVPASVRVGSAGRQERPLILALHVGGVQYLGEALQRLGVPVVVPLKADDLVGIEITYQPERLRRFTARF